MTRPTHISKRTTLYLSVALFAVLLVTKQAAGQCPNACSNGCDNTLVNNNLSAQAAYQQCLSNPANNCQSNPNGFACTNCTLGYDNTVQNNWNTWNLCYSNCCTTTGGSNGPPTGGGGVMCQADCTCDCDCNPCNLNDQPTAMNVKPETPSTNWLPLGLAPFGLAACFVRIRKG